MDACTIQNLNLRLDLTTQGAEMVRFGTVGGLDLLWSGDPAVWGRKAPILFPVVGRVCGDVIRHEGQTYPMPRHGFARDMNFRLARLSREFATFALKDSPETRQHYPFPFDLRITYRLEDWTLKVEAVLTNTGDKPLPASLGAHPAFRWPLVPGMAKAQHILVFDQAEEGPVRQLDAEGFLRPDSRPSPLQGNLLALHDGLFEQDALILENLRSRCVRLAGPVQPSLEIRWEGFQHLGLWSKPGAGFLCVEPWSGLASPQGFDGEFTHKPGVLLLWPGSQRTWRWSVRLLHEG